MQPLVLNVVKEAIYPIEILVATFVILVSVSYNAIFCQNTHNLTIFFADNVICYNVNITVCSSLNLSSIITTTTKESCCTNQVGGLSYFSQAEGCNRCELNNS